MSSAASPVLSIKNLDISFSANGCMRRVLLDFNLDLYSGRCVGLVGESGSGKTLAGLSMLQLLPNNAMVGKHSQILMGDQDILLLPEKKMREIRGSKVSMIFQDALSALNPVLTIGSQLAEVFRLHLHLCAIESKERSIALLTAVGIKDPVRCYASYPHELSGGMRQRVMIAIAVAIEPDVIIADEPTTALDVTIQAQVLSLLKELQYEKQCALLFVGHDLSVVAQMADDMVVLENGKIVEKSSKTVFFQQPAHPYSKKLLSAVLPEAARNRILPEFQGNTLDVKNLKIHYKNNIKAVDDISFSIQKGETVALVGESGSGKTSAVKGILQLLRQAQGEVFFEGDNLSLLSKKALRRVRADMQLIFQDPATALNPRILVADSLIEGLLIQKRVKNKKAALTLVKRMLLQVGLPDDVIYRYPHEFSGGQKQRLCIARALSLSPNLLILDEPTSALDVSVQKQILDLLLRIQEGRQLSYFLITHNLSVVAYLAHRVLVMYQGRIVEQGDTHTILTSPQHPYTQQLIAAMPKAL